MLPLLTACVLAAAPARAASSSEAAFKTSDGWTLEALYHPPRKGGPVAVLVHGVASDKHEWDAFAAELARRGWGTLALDLRGHGGSVKGPRGKTDYKGFDASGEWPRMDKDLQAALGYLARKKVLPERVVLVGASIGANLASRAAARGKGLRGLVLLSPGEDYRGVILARELPGKKVLIAASPGDAYAYRSSVELMRNVEGSRFLEAATGHGVQMFEDKAFLARLLEALQGLGG